MFSTAIIIFRETLEIAMILGVVLAATRGLPGRMKWIFGGLAAGTAGAGLVAAFAETISAAAAGMGQELFNACILFAASLVIGWTAVWMKTNAREMVMEMRQISQNVMAGKLPGMSLSVVIGLAILREGSEIVLFIYSMIQSGQSAQSIALGSVIGITLGTVAGIALYMGLIKMSARYMLRVTGWLLVLLVAGLSSQAAGFLSQAGYFSHLSKPVWNSSWLLNDDGIVGKALHSLIGYTAHPSPIEIIFYVGTLAIVLFCMKFAEKRQTAKKAAPVAVAAILALFLVAAPRPAHALDEVYSPIAEPGELSYEYSGSRTFDGDKDKNNEAEHEVALEYGMTDRIVTEVSAGFERDPGDGSNTDLDDLEIEGRYQITEQGKYWLDAGVLAAYDFATHSEDPDTLEVKLLLQKDIGKITSTANIGFEQEIGNNSEGGPDWVLLWNTRYRMNQYFQPGIELQSDFGQDDTVGHFNDQEHYIGPAVYGTLFGHLKYQAAWLAGVSQASASSAARVNLEWETHF